MFIQNNYMYVFTRVGSYKLNIIDSLLHNNVYLYNYIILYIFYFRHRAGIFVHHVVAGSPADECGCFSVGDRILEVNGYNIKHTTIDHAAAVMGVRGEGM